MGIWSALETRLEIMKIKEVPIAAVCKLGNITVVVFVEQKTIRLT